MTSGNWTDKQGKIRELSAKDILAKRGFTNICRPADRIGDFIAERNGITYRIEVKSVNSLIKSTVRKGVHIGLHKALRAYPKILSER